MLELIKNAGLSRTELSKRLGVSLRLVSYWCSKERKPDILMTAKIAKALNVEIAEVVACFTENE